MRVTSGCTQAIACYAKKIGKRIGGVELFAQRHGD